MAGGLYATEADLYRFGLPRGALANPGRLVGLVSASTDAFELDGHGFATDDEVRFRAESGGAMPSPLVVGTTYYAIPVDDTHFQVSATAGGAAINLTSGGESVVVSTSLPVDDVIERYSRFVDDHMPAHLVPFEAPIPIRVVAIVAELSAQRLLWISGQRSIAMDAIEAAAHKELARWAAGIPLRDTDATARANLATARAVSRTAGRGWDTSDGSIP
jgi:hypothetical protein